jgi:hypothetical protein
VTERPNDDEVLREIVDRLRRTESGERPPRGSVEGLRTKLAQMLKAEFREIAGRDYDHSDALVARLDASGRPPSEDRSGSPVYAARIRLSYIAPYAVIEWLVSLDGRHWVPLAPEQLTPALRGVSTIIFDVLRAAGVVVLSGDVLDAVVPDRRTELDDEPATVYATLFTELGG